MNNNNIENISELNITDLVEISTNTEIDPTLPVVNEPLQELELTPVLPDNEQ